MKGAMDKEELIKRIRRAADVFTPLLGKLKPVSEGEKPQNDGVDREPDQLRGSGFDSRAVQQQR